jgi:hypothetical protein
LIDWGGCMQKIVGVYVFNEDKKWKLDFNLSWSAHSSSLTFNNDISHTLPIMSSEPKSLCEVGREVICPIVYTYRHHHIPSQHHSSSHTHTNDPHFHLDSTASPRLPTYRPSHRGHRFQRSDSADILAPTGPIGQWMCFPNADWNCILSPPPLLCDDDRKTSAVAWAGDAV